MIAIVVDSNSQIPPELAARLGIEVVPLTVTVDGVAYREGVDIDADDFYARFETGTAGGFHLAAEPGSVRGRLSGRRRQGRRRHRVGPHRLRHFGHGELGPPGRGRLPRTGAHRRHRHRVLRDRLRRLGGGGGGRRRRHPRRRRRRRRAGQRPGRQRLRGGRPRPGPGRRPAGGGRRHGRRRRPRRRSPSSPSPAAPC